MEHENYLVERAGDEIALVVEAPMVLKNCFAFLLSNVNNLHDGAVENIIPQEVLDDIVPCDRPRAEPADSSCEVGLSVFVVEYIESNPGNLKLEKVDCSSSEDAFHNALGNKPLDLLDRLIASEYFPMRCCNGTLQSYCILGGPLSERDYAIGTCGTRPLR